MTDDEDLQPDLQDLPFVTLYALRNAMGGMSYGVGITLKFVRRNWPLLIAQSANILREINEYLLDIKRGYYPRVPADIIADWQATYDYLTKHAPQC